MSIKGSFKKGSLDMLVLALLTSGDKYGYEISQAIGERGSSVLRLPEGSLYNAVNDAIQKILSGLGE